MAIGDGHSGEGRTLYTWDEDVRGVVRKIKRRFPQCTVNTYTCHPFCGWERRSLDVWWFNGRGHGLPPLLARHVLDFALELPGDPLIRHYILDHTLWVADKGTFEWAADDHTGQLRHVHLTYKPVPEPR